MHTHLQRMHALFFHVICLEGAASLAYTLVRYPQALLRSSILFYFRKVGRNYHQINFGSVSLRLSYFLTLVYSDFIHISNFL